MHTTLDLPCVICVTGGHKPGSVYRSKGSTNLYGLVSQPAPAQADQTLLPYPASIKNTSLLAGWHGWVPYKGGSEMLRGGVGLGVSAAALRQR